MNHNLGYIALCLIAPLLWGLATARVFDWWQARHTPRAPDRAEDDRADMYHI